MMKLSNQPGIPSHVVDLEWGKGSAMAAQQESQRMLQATEAAMREAQERLKLVLRAANVVVWDWDLASGDVQKVGAEALLDPAQTHHELLECVHPDDRPAVEEVVRRMLAGESAISFEHRIVRPDGGISWVWDTGMVRYDSEGRPQRLVGAAVDITQRKLAEEELARQKRAADQSNAAKDRFMAILSHELRTPLMPVLTTVSAMISETGQPAQTVASLQMIKRNVEMEARLIDDLLDVTRIAHGKLQLHKQQIDARLPIGNAVETCLDEIRAKHIAIYLELEPQRPYAYADPARLQQIVWNLLRNAVKFTAPLGRITLRCDNDEKGWLRITVTDTGMGIDPQTMGKIFDAFNQGEESVGARYGGLGLGLTISKALVEAHEGKLTAYSKGKGHGATFTVSLPTIEEEPARAEESRPAPSPELKRRGTRILLVEDHTDTLRAMKRLLQQAGHQVFAADSVASAREVAAAQEVDLLIADIGLPDGNGLDLLRELRRRGPIKAIALSGYGMEEDIRQSQEAGFQAHLTKPIDLKTLEAVIAQLMGQR